MFIEKTIYITNYPQSHNVMEIYQQIPDIMFRDEPLLIMHYVSLGRHDQIFDKSGPYIKFFPSGKVKEIASYYATCFYNEKGSYREFDESGKVVGEKINKYSPLPTQEDLPEKMVRIIKEKNLWDNVVAAFKAKPTPRKPKVISKHSRRQASDKENVKTR